MSRPRLVALLLALVTLLLYLPARRHDFVAYDDDDYVTRNRVVQQGLTGAGIRWAFTSFHASNWHPLTWLSHMLDCELFGLNPGTHHLVNLLLHAANAVLLFWLLLRLTAALWPSALVAALFAWHPLHVESVAWVAERKDVLSTFFGLLTLLAYARYAEGKRTFNIQHSTRNAQWWYWLALVFFACGLMSKPMLVTLPFVMLLLDWWPLRRFQFSVFSFQLFEKWPFFLLTIVSCVLTFQAQRGVAVVALERVPLGLRLENAVVAYASYLGKAIWPDNLAVIYPLPREIPLVNVAAAVGLLAVVSLFVWRARHTKPFLLFGWLWFLGMLVPVIGLVQVGGQAMADRYTYLPLVGIFIAVAFGGAALAEQHRWKPTFMWLTIAFILGGCLFATARQLSFWRDSETLFTHAVSVTTNNPIARINLGVALEQRGRREEALAQYEMALRLDPGRAQAHNNLAALLDELGRTDEARQHYQEALRLNPDAPLAHANFGTLQLKLGQFEEAAREYAEAARLAPDDPRPLYLMGKAALKRGNPSAAVAHFRDALHRDENDYQTLTFLARMLAAATDPQIRNGAEAVALAGRANELTGGGQPFVLDALAMALAEAGQFKDAELTLQRALEICAAADETNAVPDMRQRLELYRAGQPWREPPTNSPP